MKTIKNKIQLLGCLMTLIVTSSCSLIKNTDSYKCNSMDLFGEASIALGFYEKALNAYSEDQSTENCKELKVSGNEYIEAVEAYRNCVPDGNAEIDDELDGAKTALANTDC